MTIKITDDYKDLCAITPIFRQTPGTIIPTSELNAGDGTPEKVPPVRGAGGDVHRRYARFGITDCLCESPGAGHAAVILKFYDGQITHA